jgi:anti-sigma B factor antagonist
MAADPLTDASPFRLSLRPDRSRMFIAPEGELDIASAAAVGDEVEGLWARGFTEVVLDLRDVTFMDSTGICLLLRLQGAAERDGTSFSVCTPSAPVQRVLALCGLGEKFGVPVGPRALAS